MVAMSLQEWREDGMPAWRGRSLEKNQDKMIRPFETMLASGHNTFSYGHLLKVAGHDGSYTNLFSWEEIWMAYIYWKKGYTLYAPNDVLIFHNYDRTYRPNFGPDQEAMAADKGRDHLDKYRQNGKRMRETIVGDTEYRRYMDSKWGVDLLGREGNKIATDCGLDPYYFWDP